MADDLKPASKKNTCSEDALGMSNTDSRFSCNICFDEVTEPVVTKCGHLYCWPCLFQWLEPGMRRDERQSLGMTIPAYRIADNSRRLCPVCKLECPVSSVIPVYIRAPTFEAATSAVPKSDSNTIINNADENTHHQQQAAEVIDAVIIEPENSKIDLNEAVDEGLRRRRVHRSSPERTSSTNEIPVPNRPSVNRPQEEDRSEPSSPPGQNSPILSSSPPNSFRVGSIQITPRSPNGHNASLTHGILSSLQRATAEYYRNNNPNYSNSDTGQRSRRTIPSLHDQRNPLLNRSGSDSGRFGEQDGGYYHQYNDGGSADYMADVNPETTEYLSRLLIMLTSFVIFCLLLV